MRRLYTDTLALMPQACTIVRHNLAVQPAEEVLLVWDGTVSEALLQACQIAIEGEGAKPSTLVYAPLSLRDQREYCFFAGASLIPDKIRIPPILEAAMRASDAVILLCSDMDLMLAPDWRDVLDHTGGRSTPRMLFLPYLTTSAALRMLPASEEEVQEQYVLVNACGERLERATEAHVTSDAGTNIYMRLGQWPVRLHLGIAPQGGLQVLPAGQVTRVPDDNSVEGLLVIDRTVADNDYKALCQPIKFHIKSGKVVDIEGNLEGQRIKTFLRSLNDPRIYHVTELGIGANPRCKLDGVGGPTEDTHKWGTVSMALGCDVHIGGGVPAPAHIDMTMRSPSLVLDGVKIVDKGRLLVKAAT